MTLFDLAFLNDKVERLEKEQNREDFWSDQRKAVSIIDDYNDAKEERDTYLKIQLYQLEMKILAEGKDSHLSLMVVFFFVLF